ncbi:MAG: nuclear transport factor 2 family protein [Polyangiales bacterium]
MSIDARQAIAEQMIRYSFAVDDRDPTAYLAVFTEEAELVFVGPDGAETMRMKGKSRIAKVFEAQLRHNAGQTRHLPTSPVFRSLEAERASTRAPFIVTMIAEGRPRVLATGCYEDQWMLSQGEWKLALRRVVLDAVPG